MSCSWIGSLMSSRAGRRSTLPLTFSASSSSHSGTPRPRAVSTLDRISGFLRLASLTDDRLPGLHLVGGDRDLAAVDLHVAMADELPRLGARGREAQAVDDVVEPPLEHAPAGSRR